MSAVDGNKLTIKLDHAGEKRVVDSFVERVWRVSVTLDHFFYPLFKPCKGTTV